MLCIRKLFKIIGPKKIQYNTTIPRKIINSIILLFPFARRPTWDCVKYLTHALGEFRAEVVGLLHAVRLCVRGFCIYGIGGSSRVIRRDPIVGCYASVTLRLL